MDKTVPPGRVKGTLTPPCSKSYAQRALAAALLSEEVSVLRNIEFCDDTRSALQCIETLGARVRRVDPTSLSIEGGLSPKGCVLNVGESGLSTRLFTPVASLCPTPVTIEGRGSLLRRPMQMMFEPLRRLGVRVRDNGGFLPIEVCGPIQGGEAEVDGSVSSQFITGLLLALPLARRDTSLHVRGAVSTPYLDMTLDTAARFGIEISQRDYEEFYIPGRQRYRSTYFSIEGDWSAAAMLLVAGATGQGKSVGLNAIITSLLYRKHPAQLKFVMIDPKMVEFSLYAKIERHFLAKMESEDDAIITDPKKAVYTLNSLCTEMDNRLELCKKAGARNIAEYNEKFTSRRLNPMNGHRYLPYIVVVVDEFADLIMTAREVEGPVMRLAQKARAIGIHLIIATQRPDVKVITGGIKANFPARIAFRVMQMIDSRTIIDQPGANQLIGRGDMLFSKDGDLTRIQCALVETREVERICEYISKQQGYTEAYTLPDYTPDGGDAQMGSEESSAPVKYDSLFAEIARDAVSGGQISTSMIQRNYEVGFNRAGRIMMQLERAGIVGRQQGAKPRDILYHDLPSLEAKLQELGLF